MEWYGYKVERPPHYKDNTKRDYDRPWSEVEKEIRDEYYDDTNFIYVNKQVDDAKRRWINRMKQKEEEARRTTRQPTYDDYEDYDRESRHDPHFSF